MKNRYTDRVNLFVEHKFIIVQSTKLLVSKTDSFQHARDVIFPDVNVFEMKTQ